MGQGLDILKMCTPNTTEEKEKGFKHPDFPAGHPRQYYPGLLVLNFSNQAGWGVFTRVWPNPIIGLDRKAGKTYYQSVFTWEVRHLQAWIVLARVTNWINTPKNRSKLSDRFLAVRIHKKLKKYLRQKILVCCTVVRYSFGPGFNTWDR